jgi:putative oxidoreductase
MDQLQKFAAPVGRVMLALIFILSGIGKITGYDGTAQYMAAKGLPMIGVLLPLTILTELGGGILLAIGFQTRWVALALSGFCIISALIFHDFWTVTDPMQHMNQQINFLKNVSMAGGLLMIFSMGPGYYHVDRKS